MRANCVSNALRTVRVIAPAFLALAYAIAVVVAAWTAPEKGFLVFTGDRVVHVERGGIADRVSSPLIVRVDGLPVTSTPCGAVLLQPIAIAIIVRARMSRTRPRKRCKRA